MVWSLGRAGPARDTTRGQRSGVWCRRLVWCCCQQRTVAVVSIWGKLRPADLSGNLWSHNNGIPFSYSGQFPSRRAKFKLHFCIQERSHEDKWCLGLLSSPTPFQRLLSCRGYHDSVTDPPFHAGSADWKKELHAPTIPSKKQEAITGDKMPRKLTDQTLKRAAGAEKLDDFH